jgi:hypothetical protein
MSDLAGGWILISEPIRLPRVQFGPITLPRVHSGSPHLPQAPDWGVPHPKGILVRRCFRLKRERHRLTIMLGDITEERCGVDGTEHPRIAARRISRQAVDFGSRTPKPAAREFRYQDHARNNSRRACRRLQQPERTGRRGDTKFPFRLLHRRPDLKLGRKPLLPDLPRAINRLGWPKIGLRR